MGLTPISKMIDNKKNTIMGYDRFLVEDGVRTLQKSREIEGDPQFMKAIQAEAQRQREALASITKKDSGYFQPKRGGV